MLHSETSVRPLGRVTAWLGAVIALQVVIVRTPMVAEMTSGLGAIEVVCLVVLVLTCGDAVRAGLGPRHLHAVVAVALAHVVANLGVAEGATGADQPGSFLFVAQAIVTAALLGQPRRFAAVVSAVTIAYLSSRAGFLGAAGFAAAADEMIAVVGTCIALLYLFSAIATAVQQATLARRLGDFVDRQRDDAELARRAQERAQRILHDEVIAALVSIPLSDPQVAEHAATVALTALRDARTTGEWVLDGRRRPPIMVGFPQVSWVIEDGFDVGDWPRDVIAAMAGATAEALRNVARHSGVDEARVSVAHDARTLTVVVEDRGVGRVGGGSREGFGIASSIRGRMADAGGSATIVDSLPQGTSVRLAWSAPSSRRTVDAWTRAYWSVALPTRGVSALTTIPLIAFALAQQWLAVRYVARNDHPWLGVAVAVALAVWTLVAIRRGSAGPLNARVALGGLVFTYAMVGIGLWAAGAGSLLGFESWVIGCATPPLLLLGLVAPLRWALAGGLGLSAVVLAAAVIDPTLAPTGVVAPITGPMIQVGLVIVMGQVIRRNGTNEDRESWSFASAAIDEERVRVQTRELLDGSTAVATLVGPFLKAVGEGSIAVGDHMVAAEARHLAQGVRDHLNAPTVATGPIPGTLLAARRDGTDVTIRPMNPSAELLPALRPILLGVLARVTPQHSVVLSQLDPGHVKIVVRPAWAAPAEGPQTAAGQVSWSSDSDATWVTVTASERPAT